MKISIITVCLNSEETIEQTIRSVIEQNDYDYEYIIIDGESTDRTLEIIRKYKESISMIISEPDNGLYDAMNKGIALATGDIIGIINSDDWYEPEIFKKVRKCFLETDVEAIYGNLNLVYPNGEVEILVPTNIEKIRYEMEIPHPTVFIKQDVYKRLGTFELKYKIAADYDLMLRLYTSGVRFGYQNSIFANFRFGGVSNKQAEKCMKETLEISQKYLTYAPLGRRGYFKNIILNNYKAFYFTELLNNYPQIFLDILNKKLGVRFDEDIVIFGAGRWGIKVCKILLVKGIHPLFLVDNDLKKWNKTDSGIKILTPEAIKFFRGVLLIMVKDATRDILIQIETLYNPELYCVIWEDIVVEILQMINIKC